MFKKISPLFPLWNKNVEAKIGARDLEMKYICDTNMIVTKRTTTTTTKQKSSQNPVILRKNPPVGICRWKIFQN